MEVMTKIKNTFLQNIKTRLVDFKNWYLQASWKKRIIIIVLLIFLLIVLKNILLGEKKQPYTFDSVQRGTITQLVTENGNVIASNETDVFSPTTGVLDHLYIKNGDLVRKGDALFTVRSTATPQEQAVAYANYETALSTLTTAQNTKQTMDATMWAKQQAYLAAQNTQNYKNNNKTNPATNKEYTDLEKLAIDNTVIQTQKDFTSAEQVYKTADAAIADAQAHVTATYLAYQATQNTTILAPTSGTISNIIGLTGAKVIAQVSSAVTSTTSTASTQAPTSVTPVLVIGNTNGYALSTTVNEVDINKVALGQTVTVL